MRFGIDIDGVLAIFDNAFMDVLKTISGKDCPRGDVPCWGWMTYYGYTHQDINKAWRVVDNDPSWWVDLPPDPSVNFDTLDRLARDHDVYYITSRHGDGTKRQTERWLAIQGVWNPTVLLAKKKGPIVGELDLTAFIDDRLSHCDEIRQCASRTHCYLRKRLHNEIGWSVAESQGIHLAADVHTMIDHELAEKGCGF